MQKLTIEQQKQLTFLHHALWCFAKELPQDQAILIAKISEFRNAIESQVVRGEENYCESIPKGGALLLNNTLF